MNDLINRLLLLFDLFLLFFNWFLLLFFILELSVLRHIFNLNWLIFLLIDHLNLAIVLEFSQLILQIMAALVLLLLCTSVVADNVILLQVLLLLLFLI